MSKSMESDGNKVIQEIIFAPGQKKYRFCKHIASRRLPGLTSDLITRGKHCLLIRNLLDMLLYLLREDPEATLRGLCDDLGIPFQTAMLNAKVSVLDSIVQGGDGVWEGFRVYNGKIFRLEEHLDRLFDSAKVFVGLW
ncbi:hypothetical protein OROMI_006330 [Orobanche minor]